VVWAAHVDGMRFKCGLSSTVDRLTPSGPSEWSVRPTAKSFHICAKLVDISRAVKNMRNLTSPCRDRYRLWVHFILASADS
jgi:hypothetical protein